MQSWTLAISSTLDFASFSWALLNHFQREGRMPLGMRILSLVSLVGFASNILLLRINIEPVMLEGAGVSFYAVIFVLFWWTVRSTRARRFHVAYSANTPDFVQADGPYSYVRHPFYLCYILFWLTTGMTVGGWQWVTTPILVGWYFVVARREERNFEGSDVAGHYAAYKSQTGMMFPKLALRPMFWLRHYNVGKSI